MENSSLKTALVAAERLSHLGKLHEAIVLLEPHLVPPFVRLSDEQSSAVFALSTLHLLTEQWREGERLVEAALTVATPEQRADLRRRRSHFYDARGHRQKATAEREKAMEAEAFLEDTGVRAFGRALRIGAEHDPEATYQAALKALEILPKDRAAVSMMLNVAASAAWEAGRYDEMWALAGKTIAHAHARPADQATALWLKAGLHTLQGDHASALDRLQEATYLVRKGADWQSATALALQTAQGLLLLGKARMAAELVQETLARFPYPAPSAQNLLVACAYYQGGLAEAEEALQSAEASTRKRHSLAPSRALIALEKHSYSEALTHLNEHLRSLGGAVHRAIRMQRVPVLWQAGKQKEAEQEHAALTVLFADSLPRETQASFYRMEARLAYIQKDWAVGILAWKKVLRLEPHPMNQPENWAQLGDGYAAHEETEAARFAWGRAAAQSVESLWVRRAKERLEAS